MNRDQFVQKRALYATRQDEASSSAEGSEPRPPQILSLEASGFSLLIDGRPVFLPYRDHPAFVDVSVDKLRQVQWTGSDRLHWPELDVNLSLSELQSGNTPP